MCSERVQRRVPWTERRSRNRATVGPGAVTMDEKCGANEFEETHEPRARAKSSASAASTERREGNRRPDHGGSQQMQATSGQRAADGIDGGKVEASGIGQPRAVMMGVKRGQPEAEEIDALSALVPIRQKRGVDGETRRESTSR